MEIIQSKIIIKTIAIMLVMMVMLSSVTPVFAATNAGDGGGSGGFLQGIFSMIMDLISSFFSSLFGPSGGLELNKTKLELVKGATSQLEAKLDGKKVAATFSSNNTSIAKVDKNTGKVTAGTTTGETTITATYDGKTATCKVNVKNQASDTIFIKQGRKNKNMGYASSVTKTTSTQYKILNGKGAYKDRMTVDSDTKIVMIDGEYYCSALGTYFGSVGDKFTVTLDNGNTIKVIMCDAKSTADADYFIDGKTVAHKLGSYYDYLEFYFRGADLDSTTFKKGIQSKFEGKVVKMYNETTGKTFE